jgi:hypothetical protein
MTSHAQSSSLARRCKILRRVLSARPENTACNRLSVRSSACFALLFSWDTRSLGRQDPRSPESTSRLSLSSVRDTLIWHRGARFRFIILNLLFWEFPPRLARESLANVQHIHWGKHYRRITLLRRGLGKTANNRDSLSATFASVLSVKIPSAYPVAEPPNH